MNLGFQCRTTARASTTGVGVPACTKTTTAAITATGAAVCIAMHSGQWSASLSSGCICATWTTVSSASRIRHTTVATGKALSFARRFPRRSVSNPAKNYTPTLRIHTIGRTRAGPGLLVSLVFA